MKFVNHPRLARASRAIVPAALLGLLSACVTPPPRTYAVPAPPPQRVFVYPAHGQSPEQTERDRYECHTWAVQQTGVDHHCAPDCPSFTARPWNEPPFDHFPVMNATPYAATKVRI